MNADIHKVSDKIPLDPCYVSLVGEAMYAFSYYEWTIIYLIQYLAPSEEFVHYYSRDKENYMSSDVLKVFRKTHENTEIAIKKELRKKLKQCAEDFKELIFLRNALSHAHPASDVNGDQILVYQSNIEKEISDMKWSFEKVIEFISLINDKISLAAECHDTVREISQNP